MRHEATDPTRDASVYQRQAIVNEAFVEFSRKTGVKLIATNDAHFLNDLDADAHDRLLCLNTGKDLDDPTRLRYTGQEISKPVARCRNYSGMFLKRREHHEIFEKIEYQQ